MGNSVELETLRPPPRHSHQIRPRTPGSSSTMRHQDHDEPDPERVAFLQTTQHAAINDAQGSYRDSRLQNVFSITIAASVLILAMEIVCSIPIAPRMVIFEEIICRKYYDETLQSGTGLGDCKIEPVQSELSRINGWKETFDTIPGLALSIPYGTLANRIGRDKVLMLALIGCVLAEIWVAVVCLLSHTLPLRAVWLSGVFQLIGGGDATVISMCYTLIGDACAPEQRTTAFSQIHAATLLSELISIPLGSLLISVSPWIPVIGAPALMALATLVALLYIHNFASSHTNKHMLDSDDSSWSLPSASSKKTWYQLGSTTWKLASASGWITKDVMLMLVAFFLCQIGRRCSSVLLQYSSVTLDWEFATVRHPFFPTVKDYLPVASGLCSLITDSFAQASYLIALRAGVNMFVIVVLIPCISRYLISKRGFRQSQTDKYITVISGLWLLVGSIFIFLSGSPLVLILGQISFAFGLAFPVTARSFLTTMVDQRHLSLLYTSITAAEYGGVMIGGPLLAGAFQWGLNLGGFWVGMPFLVIAVLFAVCTISVSVADSTLEMGDVPSFE
ncbi:hypothetical protein QQS21_007907 [Conoideocrella luteorostrata]|uniref:Major facilitator superfamily domain-containing protein n=1 Tax=Conoideocrella luteorostrata TaxID=1105319 RepID=A0AAJ0FRP0_9HYPO|nr:hypothetical protein QQS21_007907 [Conoideocrella luteorostrata]